MSANLNNLTRRQFVRRACCAAVGSTAVISTLAQLRVMGAIAGDASDVRSRAAALPGDYKALVCLFLRGGNDATNIIVPSDTTSYNVYARARAELAVARSALLPINARKYADGRSYALHPGVSELHTLYNQGKLAFLANVGTLVRPTTLAQFRNGQAVPTQLFSHSDQVSQWQSSLPDRLFTTGWGGRLADIVNTFNSNNQISMSISLAGTNSFQMGDTVSQYVLKPSGVVTFIDFPVSTTPGPAQARYHGQKAILNSPGTNLLGAAFANTTNSAIKDGELLSGVLANAPRMITSFPNSTTAGQLAMVAKLISLSPTLGLKRQVFFVELNGFDLHAEQLTGHGPLLAETSAAMKAFYDATVELGVENQVTTFTASDFGRTYIPNAGGTDHGWGNHQMIMGGAVQGGDIYGSMPSLVVNGPDDTGRGRWIPSTSVDEYNATLATWFGVSASNLSTVLPNIGRFAKPNLGFMG
jgi:uncharacterized protein (DUF1501 family)